MGKDLLFYCVLIFLSCNSSTEKKQTKNNFDICTNYSINEVFNDSILENSIRLEYFNEQSSESIESNKNKPFIRLMFFDEIDTCSIISFTIKENCSIVEIKRSLPKYFNLINFDSGEHHDLYTTIEYNYKRKVLNFYRYEDIIKLFYSNFSEVPKLKPKQYVTLENFDGIKYEKLYSDKVTFDLVNNYIASLK